MTNKIDLDLIYKIVELRYDEIYTHGFYKAKLGMIMDIEAAYVGCFIDLQKLLEANGTDFYHEIINMRRFNKMVVSKRAELDLILKIAERGYEEMSMYGVYKDKLSMLMDLEAAHADCPLDLQRLLDADEANFYHDVMGIFKNINRRTKKLENCFVPRFAKREEKFTGFVNVLSKVLEKGGKNNVN